jgi:hypothetical protein
MHGARDLALPSVGGGNPLSTIQLGSGLRTSHLPCTGISRPHTTAAASHSADRTTAAPSARGAGGARAHAHRGHARDRHGHPGR